MSTTQPSRQPARGCASVLFDAGDAQTADTTIPNPQFEVAPGRWVTTYHNSTGEIVPVALEGGGLAVVWSAGYAGNGGQYAGQTTKPCPAARCAWHAGRSAGAFHALGGQCVLFAGLP